MEDGCKKLVGAGRLCSLAQVVFFQRHLARGDRARRRLGPRRRQRQLLAGRRQQRFVDKEALLGGLRQGHARGNPRDGTAGLRLAALGRAGLLRLRRHALVGLGLPKAAVDILRGRAGKM